jgi:phage head maturation protease
VFNREAIIDSWEGRFREMIAPGSMKRSFRETPPKIQFDHGRHPMIGSIPIAELRSISEDTDPVLAPDGGAHIIGRVFDNWLMQPVRDAIAGGAVDGMSFRFTVVRESWAYADGRPIKDDAAINAELMRCAYDDVPDEELPVRTLKELKVPEVGPVTWPAYADTSVGMRSTVIDLGRIQERDPEQLKLLARAVFIADTAEQDAQQDAEAVERPSTEEEDAERASDAQQDAEPVVERPSPDAQQSTPVVGERPSQPVKGRRSIDVTLRSVRDMLRDINIRKEAS